MGRPINPNNLDTILRIERAAARAERSILARPLAEVIPIVREGTLDVEIGLTVGANGGLREIEIGDVRRAGVRLTVHVPVESLAPGRLAPLLAAAMSETLDEIRAAA
jgi:hypothetical protein